MLRAAEIQPRSLEPLGTFDEDAAKAAVTSYMKLSNPLKPIIRMATDRFDRALRRHDPGDAAVEMSTTLESLLGDGSGELVWKVGLRASIVAGGDLERRANGFGQWFMPYMGYEAWSSTRGLRQRGKG
jgi:hypothetical protein